MYHRLNLASVPDLLALHQFNPDAYPYLLASNTSGHANSRYSILMAYPEAIYEQVAGNEDILSRIDTDLTQTTCSTELPFIGGWFVFLSYEYAQLIEPSVVFHQPPADALPLAFIARIPAAVIIDHHNNSACIVAQDSCADLTQTIKHDLEAVTDLVLSPLPQLLIQEEDPDIYRSSLQRIHAYIRDGDIFQANLSRLWQVELSEPLDPASLYARLRQSNPSPFAALIKHADNTIISSSPERLISVDGGVAETRPIAGTHPRDPDKARDQDLSRQLLTHPKERAEHIMLIDLERNDLGRVCSPGSIRVEDRMVLESYRTVHHIVSSVCGSLEPGRSVEEVIHAVFPGGTITGCPKVRCMQIISELECSARGAYTGSLGYISDHGRMDLNILIRGMTLNGRQVSFRAGAGIVADSEIEKELNETRHKARGMIDAFHPDH